MTTHPEQSYRKLSLTQLAARYGCDKLHAHSYIPFYTDLLAGRDVKRLLEIGIGYRELMEPFVPHYVHGASLKMWEEYFPDAQIFSCDIRPDTLINEGRIRSMLCDQSSFPDLHRFAVEMFGACGKPDVIIDDGSHQLEHQVLTATVLRHFLNPGGVYVIEDCQEPELVAYTLDAQYHRFGKRPDDNVVFFKRGAL